MQKARNPPKNRKMANRDDICVNITDYTKQFLTGKVRYSIYPLFGDPENLRLFTNDINHAITNHQDQKVKSGELSEKEGKGHVAVVEGLKENDR